MTFKYTPATLKKLEQVLEEAGFVLRYERGTFASGFCVLESRRVVVVNRFLNVESRINALAEIIGSILIDESLLSGEMLRFYHQLGKKPEAAAATENAEGA